MNEKSVIFFPVERDGRVRQIDNGVVTSLNKKTPLANNPEGWQEILLIWQRSMERHGMQLKFSLPMGAVLDFATILRNDFYKFNVDRELYLEIKRFVTRFDDTYYYEYYKHLYKGELDFSTFIDKRIDRKVEITLMEGGPTKLLKAFEGTEASYPFDDDHVLVKTDGIDLFKRANYVMLSGITISNQVTFPNTWFAPFALISTEGDSPGLTFVSQNLESTSGQSYATRVSSNNWPIKNSDTVDIVINFKGTIAYRVVEYTFTTGVTAHILRILRSQDAEPPGENDYINLYFDTDQPGNVISAGAIVTHDIDIDITIRPGETIYWEGFLGTASRLDIEYLDNSKIVASFKNKFKTTLTKAYRPLDLYIKICTRAGLEPDQVISEILSTCTFFLTSGDALRQIEGAEIKTTYNDFVKSMDAYMMIGTSVEKQKAYLEVRSRFYNATDPVPLGEVLVNEIREAVDMLYTSIRCGHPEQDIDEVNGKFDFNGYHVYSTPIKRIGQRELDLTGRYYCGPYEIDKVRANFDGKTTTDANSDNRVYVLDVDLLGSASTINGNFSFVNLPNGAKMIVAPLGFDYAVGQRIRFVGTASNDFTFTVLGVGATFFGVFIFVLETVVNETLVAAQLIFETGQVYSYDRSTVVNSGVPTPETIFNVRLHPYLLLQKHLSWIAGICDKYEDGILKLESVNRNKDMVIGGVEMKRDIPVLEMPAKMFKPLIFDVTCPIEIDLPEIMEENPNKALSCVIDGVTYICFPLSAGMAADNRPQDFELLSAPINDLTKLIY